MTENSQNKQIMDYLVNGGSLTPMGALNMFGCFRLGARIYDLKQQGVDIKSRIVERNGKRFSEYYINTIKYNKDQAEFLLNARTHRPTN